MCKQDVEIWKQITGFENRYSVSNFGKVRIDNGPHKSYIGKLKKPCSANGYFKVDLMANGIKKTFTIHRLVATHFIGDRKEGYVINHKDFNKKNNRWDNLEYVTPIENIKHAMKFGTHPSGENNPNAIFNEFQIREIRSMYKTDIYTQIYLSKLFNVSKNTIYQIINSITYK